VLKPGKLTKRQRINCKPSESLRKILKILWPDKITIELWNKTKQEPIETIAKRRKWNWIGHTLRKANDNIVGQAREHQLVGKKKRGKPLDSWRRSVTRNKGTRDNRLELDGHKDESEE
jgi:hypothetical protein